MSLKIGRNDPCHCGSGKKYKKCHLAEDEAREREQLAAAAAVAARETAWEPPPPPLPPLSPLPPRPPRRSLPVLQPGTPAAEWTEADEQKNIAFWKRFDEAGYDERLRIVDEQLGPDLDAGRLFDMLAALHDDALAANDRTRFQDLVTQARGRAPEAYAEDLIWYHSWMIEDAVAARAYDQLPALVAPLADVVEKSIDEIFRLLDLLMFHDQVPLVIDLLTRAWPSVSRSPNITPFGIAELAARLLMLQVYTHLQRGGAPRADDPDLRAALESLGEIDQDRLQITLETLADPGDHAWTVDDFKHDSPHDDTDWDDDLDDEDEEDENEDIFAPFDQLEDEEEDEPESEPVAAECATLRINVYRMSLEWAMLLERERGVPFARTEVVRDTLIEYILDRRPLPDGHAPLLPDRASVEQRLLGLLSPLSGLYYEGGAFFALLPTYVDFLESRGLVKRDPARRARAEILKLRHHVLRLVEGGTTDPALHEAVRHAGK